MSQRTSRSAAAAALANTDPAVVDDPPSVVTPAKRKEGSDSDTKAKKSRNQVKKYFYFRMINGLPDEFIEGVQQANAHREEYGNLIKDEESFYYKKDFNAFKKQVEKPTDKSIVSSVKNASGNTSTIARAVVARMRNDSACDRFHGYYRTTRNSTIAVLIVRAINQYDTDTWVFRPQFLAEVFRNLAEVDPITDIIVHEAMTNFSCGKASDPDNTDKNVVLTTDFSPKDDPKRKITLDIYRAYTYFTIPVDTITSVDDEKRWIHDTSLRALRGMQTLMSSDAFKETLECLAANRQGDYIKKLFSPSLKTNLPKFLSGAVVRVDPIERLTDHVIQISVGRRKNWVF